MLTDLYWKCSLFCLLCNSVKSFLNIIVCSSTTAAGETKTFKCQFCARCAICFQAVRPGTGNGGSVCHLFYIEWLEKHNEKYRWSDILTSEKYRRFRKSASQFPFQGTAGMGMPYERAQARCWSDPAQPVSFPTGVSAGWTEWGAGDGVQRLLLAQWGDEPGPGSLWELEMRLQWGFSLSGNGHREVVSAHGSSQVN